MPDVRTMGVRKADALTYFNICFDALMIPIRLVSSRMNDPINSFSLFLKPRPSLSRRSGLEININYSSSSAPETRIKGQSWSWSNSCPDSQRSSLWLWSMYPLAMYIHLFLPIIFNTSTLRRLSTSLLSTTCGATLLRKLIPSFYERKLRGADGCCAAH